MSTAAVEGLLRAFWERPRRDLTRREGSLLRLPGKADVLVGMRRSGKTFRLYQEIGRLLDSGVEPRRILYLNLEDDRLGLVSPGLLSEALETFYRLAPTARERGAFLFLDEVQRVPEWSRFVRRVLDTEEVQVTLTGSSARLLSTEVSTEFRGRGLATEILPFSFREAVTHAGEDLPGEEPGPLQRSRLEALFDRFLEVGGLPEVQGLDESLRVRILQDYVEVVIVRDVVERHGLTNVAAARALALQALDATGCPFSVNKVYRDLRSRGMSVGKDTLYLLLEALRDAFLVFQVSAFERSERKRRTSSTKVYAVDPGLARACSHVTAEDLGARLETAVYLELRRRLPDRREGGIAHYTTASGKEVDFVRGSPGRAGALDLLQVSVSLRDPRTRTREISALEEAMEETGLERATVVTLREEGVVEVAPGPISLVPAWRWFLGLGS